jgi:ABC-2 type transport system ATP-binding protein
MVVADGLGKTFGTGSRHPVDAVNGVSFELAAGEVLGVLGPNGAGKTTTVLMLTTLVRPTVGTATVAGHDVVADPAGARREFGAALQETGLDPLQTGRELLTRQCRLWGLSAVGARRRTESLLAQFGLDVVADRASRTYSGGLLRRLDVALALVHRPRVLFLDEPTAGLDPVSRRTVWEELRTLRSEGAAVLLTTQYLEEADALADRIVVIDHGAVVAGGTPEELKRSLGHDVLTVSLEGDQDLEAARLVLPQAHRGAARQLRLAVPDGSAAVPRVTAALLARGVCPMAVTVARPSLDDVFLTVTGRNFRPEG